MREYLKLMRPHQYVKNILLFFPAFFSFKILDKGIMLPTFFGFLAYCALASAVYVMNDFIDREDDRNHPDKKDRPLAAGTISTHSAFILMGVLMTFGIGTFAILGWEVLGIGLFYFAINVAYTFKLKHIAVIDVSILAVGFVLRLFIGAGIGQIALSMWIILITFLLALFLGLAKRRTDVMLAVEGTKTRKSIDGYNLEFINAAMTMMASVVVVAYIFYTISPEIQTKYNSQYLYLTVFFVLLGILRYMQITFVEQNSGNPSKILLRDLFLQLTILAWLAAYVFLIYGH